MRRRPALLTFLVLGWLCAGEAAAQYGRSYYRCGPPRLFGFWRQMRVYYGPGPSWRYRAAAPSYRYPSPPRTYDPRSWQPSWPSTYYGHPWAAPRAEPSAGRPKDRVPKPPPVPNIPPTLNAIPDQTIGEEAGEQTVDLSGISAGGGEWQALLLAARSDNPALIPHPRLTYIWPGAKGYLTYTPKAGLGGEAKITVTVTDTGMDGDLGTADDASVEREFTVTVLKREDIVSTIQARGKFKRLLKAASVAGVLSMLDNPGPFTVLAPTDEAFDRLEPGLLDRLTASPEKLRDVLLYHALTGEFSADVAIKQGQIKTALGPEVGFKQDGDRILVNGVEIVERDVACTNGVLHVIDGVLLPPGFEFPEADSSAKPKAGSPSTPPPKEKPEGGSQGLP